MNGFWSPTTTTWPTIGLARIGSSSAAGATFLPPAVTMISFLRPVIVRKPSSSNVPMSPVLNQSPSNVAAVASGLRQYSLKTLMPRTWISPSSASRTPTPGKRGADGADLRLRREVHRRGRRRLGEAVALEDGDAEAVEEVPEAGAERRRTRDRVLDVAAHGRAELAVDEPVEQRELDLRAGAGSSCPPAAASSARPRCARRRGRSCPCRRPRPSARPSCRPSRTRAARRGGTSA